jgi:hypothetical protein
MLTTMLFPMSYILTLRSQLLEKMKMTSKKKVPPLIIIKIGVEYSKGSFPFLANSRAKCNDDYEGLIKVLTDKKTDKLLGVHIIVGFLIYI